MPRIIDLSMTIEDHFRWPVERHVKGSHAKGDVFEATWAGWPVHGFTHMDAARHCVPGGPTTEQIPLERTVGEAAVVDLTPVAPNEAIDAGRLAAAAGHVRPDDIVVMRSCWEQQRSPRTPAFWTDAPFMARAASEWLLARQPRAVGFDFAQDYAIRRVL
jgi:arylformamidase